MVEMSAITFILSLQEIVMLRSQLLFRPEVMYCRRSKLLYMKQHRLVTIEHPISDVKVEFRLPRISIKNVNQDKIENHYSKFSDMCKSLLLIRSFIASRSVCFLNKVR